MMNLQDVGMIQAFKSFGLSLKTCSSILALCIDKSFKGDFTRN